MELQDFNAYTANQRINEMATELTKLGVSKDLARFIHTLSGQMKNFGAGDRQYDPRTGREVGTFTTYSEPYKAKGGPWPEREDVPLSHDVQVRGTKSGKDRIYDYLVNYVDSRKDVGTRLILVNPAEDLAYYITRKTGKLSKKQMDELGIANTEEAREKGVSQKRGLYLRVVTIDGDSGKPVARWDGTIGQLSGRLDDQSVLYIMEEEDRVRTKRKERKSRSTTSEEEFIDYFVKNYSKIIDSQSQSKKAKMQEEFIKKVSGLTPEDLISFFGERGSPKQGYVSTTGNLRELVDLAYLQRKDKFNPDSLNGELNNFLEFLYKEGEYQLSEKGWGDRADQNDAIDKHGMPTLASMFLQYTALGKVYKPVYTNDAYKLLGLDDLL